MENQDQERVFSPEELARKKEEMKQFYEDSLPYLKAQHDYEELLMKIDEARFKRTSLQMQYAMMMNQMEGALKDEDDMPIPEPDSMPDADAPVRKLKKQ
jgi:hypothetical protein